MKKIVKILGSLAITLIVMLSPVLCVDAFVYNWDDGAKFLLMVLTFGLGIALWMFIYEVADE